MKTNPVKGTRDFYPQDMAVRNWIIDGWKEVSLRNGFEEYDGPIFEYLKMFEIKSGEEIVEQLFSFEDRGGRKLAIRPEITPTLARIVNQRINSLAKPIKWFSVPRLCRAERPQKGRLREFFQWNIDIIGVQDERADAEVIFTTVDYLRRIGLTSNDIKIKLSSRKLLSLVLKKLGVAEEDLELLYNLLDKKAKLSPENFNQLLEEKVADARVAAKIKAFMETQNISAIKNVIEPDDEIDEANNELAMVVHYLNEMGIGDYCQFDPSIVRGLAYYTGVVFEVHDTSEQLRAIGGGGRFDNLLRDFGGPSIPATGMGMGDCVLEILLREKGLLQKQLPHRELDYFVADAYVGTFNDEKGAALSTLEDEVIKIVAKLRTLGLRADFGYKSAGLSKQLKEASARNAKNCIIIGEEFKDRQLIVKDMSTGEQELINYDEFFAKLESIQSR
ncbi:MAG: histidine--tRNA ligase [Sedimentisphaerales bacterium]|nr:histidine--tRNA ligase [Sedimentisphaerales bacterium]